MEIGFLRYQLSPGRRIFGGCEHQQKGSIVEQAVVNYHGADVRAWEQEGLWTVRLGAYEASSSYLDLALSELLVNGEEVHELAARLVSALATSSSVGADEPVAA